MVDEPHGRQQVSADPEPHGGCDGDRELPIPVSSGGSAPSDGVEDGDRASSAPPPPHSPPPAARYVPARARLEKTWKT
jgi:hypothetical protein